MNISSLRNNARVTRMLTITPSPFYQLISFLGTTTASTRRSLTRFAILNNVSSWNPSAYYFSFQLTTFSNKFGAGFYNLSVAAEFRFQRIQDSIATNPQFSFISPRYFTAYAESIFPLVFFIDGRDKSLQLDMNVARGFFQNSRFPDGFFRSNTSISINIIGGGIDFLFSKHPVPPGANNGTVNSYTPNPNSADFTQFCKLYTDFVNNTIRGLYPNATGVLLEALNKNLDYFYSPLNGSDCPQVPPFV